MPTTSEKNTFVSGAVLKQVLNNLKTWIDANIPFRKNKELNSINQNEHTETTNENEVALGSYNKSTKDNTIFSIGDGTDNSNRSNALEIKKNSEIWIKDNSGNYIKLQDKLDVMETGVVSISNKDVDEATEYNPEKN